MFKDQHCTLSIPPRRLACDQRRVVRRATLGLVSVVTGLTCKVRLVCVRPCIHDNSESLFAMREYQSIERPPELQIFRINLDLMLQFPLLVLFNPRNELFLDAPLSGKTAVCDARRTAFLAGLRSCLSVSTCRVFVSFIL